MSIHWFRRPSRLAAWIFAAAFFVDCEWGQRATAEEKAPVNLVVFLADDAGWGDYAHSSNRLASTPNIDSLARDGVSLERFYVCPVCAPTRAEFLTGRYHPRTGVRGVSTGFERMNLNETTFVQVLAAAGYATGAFGKWHNGSQWPYHPMARGFGEYFGHSSGHWGEYFNAPLEWNGRMIRTQGYIADVCTDRAIEFLEQQAASNRDSGRRRPFFCFVPFTTPHSPWAAPEKEWLRWKDRPIEQRATAPSKESIDETRCVMAMMENQDWNVGRVLKRLDELGLTGSTIVVYFSDNGPNSHRFNGGMRGIKGTTDEGGVRSVCYLRYPGVLPAGRKVPQIAGAIDLAPTLLSLLGLPPLAASPIDGRDLTPLWTGQQVDWPDRKIFSTWGGRVSVRTEQFRLDDQGRLYDMNADPGQTTPVEDRHPQVARELADAADAWRKEVFAGADPRAPGGVDPRPFPVGYREFPITMLPARDGEPRGNVKRSSPAPNCSYFVNWKTKDDSMAWKVDVHTAGRYEVTIDYTCPVEDAGAVVELSLGDRRLAGRVAPGWDPPLYTNQDTLPRPHGESSMKEFRPLRLGEIDLLAGEGELVLRATEIPGESVMDVRRLTLTLLE